MYVSVCVCRKQSWAVHIQVLDFSSGVVFKWNAEVT